jgi:hypothetical protein
MEEKSFTIPQPPMSGAESRLPVSPSAGGATLAPLPFFDSERAGRLFREEVGRLPGVLQVEQWGQEGPGVPTFHIYVRPDDRDTEYAVYEVKGQIYDQYPEAYLEVVVLEAVDSLPNAESSA